MAKKAATVVEESPKSESVKLKPVVRKLVKLRIVGTSPMIQHQWSEKAKQMMRDKHAGKKTKNRDIRDPQAEGEQAAYKTMDGKYAIPLTALKSSIIGAAHKDIGCEKTLVRKALFIQSYDDSMNLPIECDEPVIHEDPVKVGMGSTDLRYRPYFDKWSVEVTFEIDAELLTVADLVSLIDRAGFGVGVGERRPERGGDFGRFKVDTSSPMTEEAA